MTVGAVVDDASDLLAVAKLGHRGSAVADNAGDLLQWYPVVGQQ